MADPMRMRLDRHIAAPPAQVWAVVGDFGNEARWLGALAASRRDTQDVRVGTVRHCTLAQPLLGRNTVEEEVLALEPERRLVYRTLDDLGPFHYAEGHWELAPDGTGTRLTVEARLMPRNRVLGWLLGPLARWQLRRAASRALDELADAMERPRLEVLR